MVAPINNNWSQVLQDKVVFITGAGGGIGSAIVRTAFLQGARVVVSDVNREAADKVVAELTADDTDGTKKGRLISLELDTATEAAIEKAVKQVVEQWKTIDVLVNAAADFTLGLVEDVTADQWTQSFNVNVRGYALMAKHVVPYMKQQRSGSIVQFASISAMIAQPGFVPYSTSKGAVLQMTRNLALDLGPYNIRCNSVAPGCIETPPITRLAASRGLSMEQFSELHSQKQCLKRIGNPQEIANLVVFLASDLCPFITGANLAADGGLTAI